VTTLELILAGIVLAGAAGAVLTRWRHGLWQAVKGHVDWVEAKPILCSIADEFKPNGGTSLRDTIDRLESAADRSRREDQEMLERLDAIDNKIDVFITCRQPGGQRHTDHAHEEE